MVSRNGWCPLSDHDTCEMQWTRVRRGRGGKEGWRGWEVTLERASRRAVFQDGFNTGTTPVP